MPQAGKALSTLFQSALAHHQSGDFVGAEHGYRALLAIDPSQAMVWSNLAAVLHEAGRNAESLQACREALRRVPDHLNAQLNLATAQQALGDFAAAASTFEAILTRHPQRADLRRRSVTRAVFVIHRTECCPGRGYRVGRRAKRASATAVAGR